MVAREWKIWAVFLITGNIYLLSHLGTALWGTWHPKNGNVCLHLKYVHIDSYFIVFKSLYLSSVVTELLVIEFPGVSIFVSLSTTIAFSAAGKIHTQLHTETYMCVYTYLCIYIIHSLGASR